tara:strand:+ start:4121 stop:4540 length:420 start_codon:yes stop_codon:yes gene_type:complete
MDYKRTKNGLLDMRYKKNINYIKNLPNTACIVCSDTLSGEGRVHLNCGHSYCVNCFAQHMRIDNRCAMCRRVQCSKKNNKEMSMDLITSLITNTIHNVCTGDLYKNDFKNIENDSVDILLTNYGMELLCMAEKWYNDVN